MNCSIKDRPPAIVELQHEGREYEMTSDRLTTLVFLLGPLNILSHQRDLQPSSTPPFSGPLPTTGCAL
jgi:hypothetical protein